MSQWSDTVRSLLGLSPSELRRPLRDSALLSAAISLGTEPSSGDAFQDVADVLAENLANALEVPISKLLVNAIPDYSPFIRSALPAQGDHSDELREVALSKHRVRMVVDRPIIEMLIDGNVVGKIEFKLDLSFDFEAAIVSVRGDRIVELRYGKTTATLVLAAEGTEIARRSNAPLALPGVLQLGEGVPLRPVAAAPESVGGTRRPD